MTMPRFSIIALALLLIHGVGVPAHSAPSRVRPSGFHSSMGQEHEVMFESYFRTREKDPRVFGRLSADSRQEFIDSEILPTMDFLFGPLTHRAMGNPQRTSRIEVDWSQPRLRDGRIELPYRYQGLWIVSKSIARSGQFSLPVPLSMEDVYTHDWKNCGDSDPDHQTPSFYWYFWDPERPGCSHRENREYMTATVRLGRATPNQTRTFPEYKKLIEGGLRMTIAFGYATDPADPNPSADPDVGVAEYRAFTGAFRRKWGQVLSSSPIRQGEYRSSMKPNLIIGERFEGKIEGVQVVVNVVVAAGIDQMEVFAKSYAHDHDDVFAWFGHSRVGGAFDAQTFRGMLRRDPDYYSLSPNYQVIYWGGCNSYSYYTLPFFELRAQTSQGRDPKGTKGLDIIANGLPSYFMLNAQNALITANAFLGWSNPTSYQSLIQSVESTASRMGVLVLAAVLGDEDNEN